MKLSVQIGQIQVLIDLRGRFRSSNASSNYDGGVDNGKTEAQPSSSSSTSGEPAKVILNNHKMVERKR